MGIGRFVACGWIGVIFAFPAMPQEAQAQQWWLAPSGQTVEPIVALPAWSDRPSRWFGQAFNNAAGAVIPGTDYKVLGSATVPAFSGEQLWLQLAPVGGNSDNPICPEDGCWVYFGDSAPEAQIQNLQQVQH
jgi:hypothetical protein